MEVVKAAAAKVVGVSRAGLPQKTMGAEDFSFFLQQRPGFIIIIIIYYFYFYYLLLLILLLLVLLFPLY